MQRVHQMITFTNASKLSQPFLSSKIQQNSSETEVIVLLNTRNTFIYLINHEKSGLGRAQTYSQLVTGRLGVCANSSGTSRPPGDGL